MALQVARLPVLAYFDDAFALRTELRLTLYRKRVYLSAGHGTGQHPDQISDGTGQRAQLTSESLWLPMDARAWEQKPPHAQEQARGG